MKPGMIDPSGHAVIDSANTGLQGEGYGLASFKKGLFRLSTVDIEKAEQSWLKIKEPKKYEHLNF